MIALLLLNGCTTFDFAVFGNERLASYELDFGDVPGELIELDTFETADGVRLWGVWARQSEPAPPLIFFPGNDSSFEKYSDRIEYYWEWGRYDVFTFDYRGFGLSGGAPGFEVLEEDGLAAVEYVARLTDTSPSEIPWVSLSLGSSVAAHTNDEIDAQVVVYESMFSRAGDVANDSVGLDLPAGWFFEDDYDNVAAVAETQSPTLVIHGLADSFIPPWHAEPIFEAAPDPKELWQPEGVEHRDVIQVSPEQYGERVLSFINNHP